MAWESAVGQAKCDGQRVLRGGRCDVHCGVMRFGFARVTPLTPTQIDWRDAFRPFIQDWRYIVWALLALGLGVPLASVGNFLPQIGMSSAVVGFPRAGIRPFDEHEREHSTTPRKLEAPLTSSVARLGYSTVKTNLYTVAPVSLLPRGVMHPYASCVGIGIGESYRIASHRV